MGKKTTKTTSTTAPPAWAQPIIQGGAQSIMDNYNANQGNLQGLEGSLQGALTGLQGQMQTTNQQLQPGYNYIGQTLGSNPGLANPANSYLQSTLDPAFANSNPANAGLSSYGSGGYLNENNAAVQQLAQFAGQQAGNSVNSAFSQAGRTGSGDHATDLARGVTQAELAPMLQNNQFEQQMQMQGLQGLGSNYNTALGLQSQNAGQLGQNYNTGLGIQNQAAGMLPSFTNAGYSGYTPLLAGTQLAGQLPYYGSQSLGTIGSLLGNYGTTTGTQPGGWGTDLLGGAAMALPFIPGFGASDRRLKTNIEKVAQASDGLGVYEWNWKAAPDGERVRGVIADEVEKLRPWAFVKGFVGGVYDGVNYGALGSLA